MAWLTIWDDGGEAEDFARAATMMPGANVTRRGEAVALFFGAPELAAPALDSMLDAWKTLSKPAKGARLRRAAQQGCQRRDRAAARR
jgi:hypothetical protein